MRRCRSVVSRVALAVALALPLAVVPSLLVPVPAAARPAPDSFADLAAKLLPAVVNVASSTTVTARNGGPGPDFPMFPPGSPFEQFFKDFMNRNHPPGGGGTEGQPAPERRMQSLGSGFVIDPSGVIVTNNHVIDGADEITVTLQDNTSLKATVIGRDDRMDIAVLKVTSDKPLPAVAFGDSDASRVGDWVLAIGNPFGLGGTVTAGIVSARGRDIRQGPYDDFIQTDAAINKGNSGGPLFNMDGQVIGINTAIYSPSGGSIGIGFSIPANLAKNVVAQLREYGHPRRGWLGVRIQPITPDIAEGLGLHDTAGSLVAGVVPGGPAEAAKIQNGDVILKFNGQDIKENHTLPRIVAETAIGSEVPVTLLRNGKEMTVTAKVGELPDDQQIASNDKPAPKPDVTKPTAIAGLGLSLAPITPDLKDKYQLGASQKGVVVTEVSPNGSAAARGLKPGDVIVEVQQEPVGTPADVQSRVDDVRKQNRKQVLILIQRQDNLQWVPLPLGSDSKSDDKGASPG
jgi:serine protease Do